MEMCPYVTHASNLAGLRYTLPSLLSLFVSSYPGAVCVSVCVYTSGCPDSLLLWFLHIPTLIHPHTKPAYLT